MAFSDPQSVTISGAANSLPRISSGPTSGAFSSADGNVRLVISHATGKRIRRSVRLDLQKVAADVLQPATNRPYTMSCYLVMDVPLFGYSVAEQQAYGDALTGYLAASSGAKLTQLLGGQS